LDSSQIELKGSEIESILWDAGVLRIRFAKAYILKSMTGSRERTRWWQAGDLTIEGGEQPAQLPEGPQISAGGDLEANVFVYRDSIPIPLSSRGRIRFVLRLESREDPVIAEGERVDLELRDVPKYIEHIRR
jgi:hypothetical protein